MLEVESESFIAACRYEKFDIARRIDKYFGYTSADGLSEDCKAAVERLRMELDRND